MKNVHVIEKEIKEERWQKALDDAFLKLRKEVSVDGFRKGNVPKSIFLNKYGYESLFSEAIDLIANEAYLEVLKEANLEPVIQPTLDVKEVNKEHVIFTITITTRPEVVLGEYKNLKVKKEKVTVSEEEIQEEVNRLTDKLAEIVVKSVGKVEKGNTAVIDFQGFVDGKELEGGSGENYPLEIGSNTFIPGFEDGLIGMSVGEEKELNLKFPENYTEELKNKEVLFKVKLNEIKERVIPKLNKEFYEDLGYKDVNTEEEFKAEVKKEIEARKEVEVENKYTDACLDKALENTKIELSEDIIDDEVHRMLDQIAENLKYQGVTLEQYMQFTNTTHEDLHKQMEPEATKRVKMRYMLEKIAEVENFEITDEELDKDATKMAEHYGITKEELIKEIGGLDMIKYDSKMRKAIEIVKE